MSAYSIERLMEFREYQKLCEFIFSLRLDIEERNDLQEILFKGSYRDKALGTSLPHKDNPSIDLQRRSSFAYLYLRNRDTFNYLISNNITLFHGTNSQALPSIIENGLSTVDKLSNKGIEVTTGENWSRVGGKRDFISLTDILDLSEEYALMQDKVGSFPVVLATNDMVARMSKTVPIHSDLSEIGVSNEIEPDNIKAIMVPSERVKFVKKLIGQKDIQVLPMDVEEKFFMIDVFGYNGICIDDNKFNEFKEGKINSTKSFDKESLRKLSITRFFSRIRNGVYKLNELTNKGEEYGRIIK